ncbi:MAG TPA: VOC family protein [Bdellovibrionota bacterium]|jgi:uncharacterized glyoxalase superfamily protein PhnB|nr:VOC family protein [Bdellovibrionota bacterium]
MLKVAPTLIVDEVEPSLRFWTERLGFEKAVDVPGDDGKLVFAMLVKGAAEVHLQARASLRKDMPYLADCRMPPSSYLYFDVEDVKALHAELKDCDIVTPLEKTFYGATHFFIREPGGHFLGFSQNGT